MSARCPEGHLSQDNDYCDHCGVPIAGVPESYGYREDDYPGRAMPQSTHSESYGGEGYGRRGYAEPAGPPEPMGARRAPADARGPADPGRGPAERPARSGGYSGYGRDGGYEERPTPTPAVPDGYGEASYGRDPGSRGGRRDYPPEDSYGSGGETLSRNRGEGRDGGQARDSRDSRDSRAGYAGDGYDRGGYGRPGRDEAAGRHGQRTTDPYGYGAPAPTPEQPGVRHTPTPASVPPGQAPAPGALDAGGRYAACPNCRTPHDPAARFCELCGMDFVTGQIPAAGAAGAAPSAPQRAPAGDRPAGYPDQRGGAGGYGDDRGVGAYPDGGGGGFPDERGGGYPADGYGGEARRGASRSQNWEPAGAGVGAAAWEAVVEAERDYYDSGDDHRVPFPSFYPRRVFALDGPRLLVGRRSESRGIHPEIDLSGAPEDPGISRAHAMFEQLPDGSFAVLDPGSTNGTRLNDDQDPIEPGQPVPLHDGDRVYMGAWTRITLRAR